MNKENRAALDARVPRGFMAALKWAGVHHMWAIEFIGHDHPTHHWCVWTTPTYVGDDDSPTGFKLFSPALNYAYGASWREALRKALWREDAEQAARETAGAEVRLVGV